MKIIFAGFNKTATKVHSNFSLFQAKTISPRQIWLDSWVIQLPIIWKQLSIYRQLG